MPLEGTGFRSISVNLVNPILLSIMFKNDLLLRRESLSDTVLELLFSALKQLPRKKQADTCTMGGTPADSLATVARSTTNRFAGSSSICKS